jgi:hypothetical protein
MEINERVMGKKNKTRIKIILEKVIPKFRSGVQNTKVFKDKSKYSRKTKHKKQED